MMKVLLVLSLLLAVAAAGRHRFLPTFTETELEGRITNGNVAAKGQFPYQVGLKLEIDGRYGYCGGTLLSNRHILTAAHCSDIVDGIIAVLGATRILDDSEQDQQTVRIPKSNIFVHEKWNPETITNDIALLKSPVFIKYNEYIQPAVLPSPEDNGKYNNYVGQMVFASGWGKDSDKATSVSEVLRYIEVPVISRTTCAMYYFGLITDKMICISGSNKQSTCNGDSGGPLVSREGDKNVVIGATSFGLALGCEVGWPGVFTRVTSYIDWIEEKMTV